MRLTVQIKLLPSDEQSQALKETLRCSNKAANAISEIAWKRRSFAQYKLHKLAYHEVRSRCGLSAQMAVRAIAKVADAYKLNKRRKRTFRHLGSIAYDDRILRYFGEAVSIWTVCGRERIPFVCDERAKEMLESRQGESDLLYRDGKWYLLATVNIKEPPPGIPKGWLGVDLGIKNIASDSDGKIYSGSHLKSLRHRYAHIRGQLQARRTNSAKRLLKKRSRKERRMARNINHVVSKLIVCKAQGTKRGISLENLEGIRSRITVRKSQRRTMHSWIFYQLRQFVEYKARLAGVPVRLVEPRNTSQTCPECGRIDKRNRPGRDTFRCVSCSFAGDADTVAAENIRRAAVNQPNVGCEAISHDYKLTPSGVGS